MRSPTQRQLDIYGFLQEYILLHKYPPTIREIGDRFGIKSNNGVRDALIALERKGLIRKYSSQARGLEVLEIKGSARERLLRSNAFTIPVVGRIAAGTPILAEENIEDTLVLDKSILPRGSEIFALKISDNSMSSEGILNGDIAIIRMQKSAEIGQIVATVINDSAILKYYHDDFSIAGILAGIIRRYPTQI